MRKSPIRHQVRTYRRKDSKVVQSYLRGRGQNSNYGHMANPTIKIVKPEGFAVHFKFSDTPGDKEQQDVIATSYIHALEKAFENKEDPRDPIEIRVVDPSLKEVFHSAGEHAKSIAQSAGKYGKQVGQAAYNEGKVLGKKAMEASAGAAGNLVGDVRAAGLQQIARRNDFWGGMASARLNRLQSTAQDKYLERLVKESYGTDSIAKRRAEIQLREKYPSVWHEMDLSHPQKQDITITHINQASTISPELKRKMASLESHMKNRRNKGKPLPGVKRPSVTVTLPLKNDGTGAYKVDSGAGR